MIFILMETFSFYRTACLPQRGFLNELPLICFRFYGLSVHLSVFLQTGLCKASDFDLTGKLPNYKLKPVNCKLSNSKLKKCY